MRVAARVTGHVLPQAFVSLLSYFFLPFDILAILIILMTYSYYCSFYDLYISIIL
jgi:hypothetical protein